MALGGNVLRQHVVEFIRGTGIVTDGVVDATSLNGPWSWQVPEGVAEIVLDGCGAGGGGGGGTATGAKLGGGGGGNCGLQALGVRLAVAPGSSLTIAVGARGNGGAATDIVFGRTGTSGGSTTIDGVLTSPFAVIGTTGSLSRVLLPGGDTGESNSGSVGEGGDGVGLIRQGFPGSDAAGRGSGNGGWGGSNARMGTMPLAGGVLVLSGNGGGGAGSDTPSLAGGNGGHGGDGHFLAQITESWGSSNRRANGNTTGSASRAGGGCGGPSVFASFPKGGDGGQPGTTPTGFGAGGGGGGGGAAGGNGSDGYVRFTYWSMD